MPDDERIEQLELQNKVLQSNNKGLKDTIEELRNQNAELRDELEVKNAELNKEKEKNKFIEEVKNLGKAETLQVMLNKTQYSFLLDRVLNSISKDKIKAKIEELEKRQVLHSRYGEIKVLQELLGEEK